MWMSYKFLQGASEEVTNLFCVFYRSEKKIPSLIISTDVNYFPKPIYTCSLIF